MTRNHLFYPQCPHPHQVLSIVFRLKQFGVKQVAEFLPCGYVGRVMHANYQTVLSYRVCPVRRSMYCMHTIVLYAIPIIFHPGSCCQGKESPFLRNSIFECRIL
jgi:hypothetical protein